MRRGPQVDFDPGPAIGLLRTSLGVSENGVWTPSDCSLFIGKIIVNYMGFWGNVVSDKLWIQSQHVSGIPVAPGQDRDESIWSEPRQGRSNMIQLSPAVVRRREVWKEISVDIEDQVRWCFMPWVFINLRLSEERDVHFEDLRNEIAVRLLSSGFGVNVPQCRLPTYILYKL